MKSTVERNAPAGSFGAARLGLKVAMVLLAGAMFALVAWCGITFTREEGRIAALWFPNAMLLVILLRSQPTTIIPLLLAALAGNIVANLVSGDDWNVALGLGLANQIEMLAMLFLLGRTRCIPIDFSDYRQIATFAGVALAAAGIAGVAAVAILDPGRPADAIGLWWKWTRADALGLVILVPAISILCDYWARRHELTRAMLKEAAILVSAGSALSFYTFWQKDYPFLFLDAPLVIIYALRLGLVGNALAIINLAIIATIATAFGHGPIHLVDGTLGEKVMVLQIFLASSFAVGLPVAALLRERMRLAEAKTDFLATISHELRTPMNGVIGFTDLLGQTRLDEQQRQFVEKIGQSGQSMVALLNEILDFARIDAGRLELEPRDVDLHALVRDSVAVFEADARKRGLSLSCTIAPDVPTLIRADPLRLRQVLLNLIGNALKFTHEGRVTVMLSRQGDGVCVAVEDTGIGIAEEHRARIFRQFEQADKGISRRYGGSGLGLAIASELVSLMGGEVSVSSNPGEGSCFAVCLPVHEKDTARSAAYRPAKPSPCHAIGQSPINVP